MPRLTIAQRVWVCIEYARVNNAQEVIRRWAIYWDNIPAPSKQTVIKTFRKFEREGSCHNLNKGRAGYATEKTGWLRRAGYATEKIGISAPERQPC